MQFKPGLRVNPIIVKELRSRMRGARAFATLTGVLLLLGAVSYALYRIMLSTMRYSGGPLSPQVGQALFTTLAFLELIMVCSIAPAVTAGAISSEQEKLTYEMLLATPLRPASILWGKLVSALSYVFLLIFAAVPMASLVFIFGGVTPRDMIKALVILVIVAVTLGVLGLFMSAWLGRTGRATVLSYLVVLALLIGPLLVYVLVGVMRQAEPPRWILVPNPMSALFSAMTPTTGGPAAGGLLFGLSMGLSGNLRVLSSGQIGVPRPLYHYTLPLYGAMTLALFLLTTRLIQPTRRWRVSWREMLISLALFLVLGGTVALAFSVTSGRYERVSILSAPTPVPVPAPVVVQKAVEVPMPVSPLLPTPAVLSPLPTPTPTPTPDLIEGDQVVIYAAVVRQLLTVDHTFEDGPPDFPDVYLVRSTDDSVGDPDAPQAEPRILPESVQSAIIAALDDLPTEFVWVDDADEVPHDEGTGSVAGGGAIITLGNVHFQEDGSALISAKLYFSMLGATGKTYVLEQVDGSWQVTGDTGGGWIS
jgi:ABC-2 type transport system permease protein